MLIVGAWGGSCERPGALEEVLAVRLEILPAIGHPQKGWALFPADRYQPRLRSCVTKTLKSIPQVSIRRNPFAYLLVSYEHIPEALSKADEENNVRQALDVVQQLKAINGATLTVLKEARALGDHDMVLKAVDRAHRQIELQAKLLGDLDDRPTVNVLVSPQWVQVRAVLMDVLQPFPTARIAVAQRLLQLEGGQSA